MSIRSICCNSVPAARELLAEIRAGLVDRCWISLNNSNMSTTAVKSDALRKLDEAIDRLIRGERDPEAMRKACEEMDAAREELRQRIGTVDVAVDLIRDARK
jgi:hypothetical protein